MCSTTRFLIVALVLVCGPIGVLSQLSQSTTRAGQPSKYVHKCQHDELTKRIHLRRMDEVDGESRTLQSVPTGSASASGSTTGVTDVNDGWHLMRFFINWNYAKTFKTQNPSLTSKYEYSVRMGEAARTYFQNSLMVNFTPRLTLRTATKCADTPIPTLDIPYDLYVVMWPSNSNGESSFAAAGACLQSTRDGRPTVGIFLINYANLKDGPLNELLYYPVFIHEILHILGFSNNLYKEFVVPGSTTKRPLSQTTTSVTMGGTSYSAIMLPEVLAWAKSYFNCQTLTGVPLENNGGDGTAGSHWEKTYFPMEVMNPSLEFPAYISGLTHALLRGSGWYYVKDYSDQYYNWGYYAGCNFFANSCPAISELYCTPSASNQDTCAGTYYGKGQCASTNSALTSSGCNYYSSKESSCMVAGSVASPQANEIYGPNSRCIDYKSSGTYSTRCHMVSCSGSGASQTVTIAVGTTSVTCGVSDSGVTLKTVGSLTIECPYVTRICGTITAQCPADCNGHGLCTQDRKCTCFPGYTGTDCSTTATVDYDKITYNDDKKSSNLFKMTLIFFVTSLLAGLL